MASGNFYQKTSKRATKVVGNPISYRVRVRTHHIGGRREVPGKKNLWVEPWQDLDSHFQGFLRPSLDPMMEIVLVSYSCCKNLPPN